MLILIEFARIPINFKEFLNFNHKPKLTKTYGAPKLTKTYGKLILHVGKTYGRKLTKLTANLRKNIFIKIVVFLPPPKKSKFYEIV